MDTQRIGAVVFLVIGLGMPTGAALMVRSSNAFRVRAIPVSGVVLEVADFRNQSGELSYRIIFEWAAPDGQKQQSNTYAKTEDAFRVGQKLDLLFDPQNPKQPPVGVDRGNLWIAVGIMSTLGIVFTGIAIKSLLRL